MSLAFTKMQACGNDFIVLDDRAGRLAGQEPALARRLCHRRFGVGADGVLVVREGRAAGAFHMMLVNADGLEGEMCGNGARCVAAWLRERGLCAGDHAALETLAGAVQAAFEPGGGIRLTLPPPGALTPPRTIPFEGRDWTVHALDVGPPHAVTLVADARALAQAPVVALGGHVRHHPAFAPRGCNVNFVAVDPDGRLRLRTYERGVEDETLGCGTGATAAAIVCRALGLAGEQVRVLTSSGDELHIDLSHPQAPTLGGTAQGVADGRVLDGWLSAQAPAPIAEAVA